MIPELLPWRFINKCSRRGDCWEWMGGRTHFGHGRFKWEGKTKIASRFIYEWVNGEIPNGLYIDHICKNPPCVQPDHLRAVTPRQNVVDYGNTIVRENALKTHCKRGHGLIGKALFIRADGRRRCQICEKMHQKKLRSRPEQKVKHALKQREYIKRKKERENASKTG